MKRGDYKICKYCRSYYHRIDFLHTFDRMITCGNIECTGKRRKELWIKKYLMMKAKA